MKQITCEMCGGTDLVKQDGVFSCQSCGTKYSVEEAKKLMIEGTVEVTGTVKIKGASNAESLIKRGQLLLEDGDYGKAAEQFDKALESEPENALAHVGLLCIELHMKNENEMERLFAEYGWMVNDPNRFTSNFVDEIQKKHKFTSADALEVRNVICRTDGPFASSKNYQNALRFGDPVLCERLKGYASSFEEAYATAKRKRECESTQAAAKLKPHIERANKLRVCIATASAHTVALRTDGTVVAGFDNNLLNFGQCNVSSWRGITAVVTVLTHTVGLKADGTVVAAGKNKYGACDVGEWRDITAVATQYNYTIGLKGNGTVICTCKNEKIQSAIAGWRDIVAVAAGMGIVALKADGTVVSADCMDEVQQCLDSWSDIVAIAAGHVGAAGLKSDGTVVAGVYTREPDLSFVKVNMSDWSNVVAIAIGYYGIVGVKADGTVLTRWSSKNKLASWTDIVAIAAGDRIVGVKSDGTVIAVGEDGSRHGDAWCDIGPYTHEKAQQRHQKDQQLHQEAQQTHQAEQWAARGLCRHCGGPLGLFIRKCKSCGR